MNAQQVYEAIMRAADKQLANSLEMQQVRAAGLEELVRGLVQQIAANASNPLACDIEDAIAAVTTVPIRAA